MADACQKRFGLPLLVLVSLYGASSWAQKPPTLDTIGTTLEHQSVAMRDGVGLDTNIYLPKGKGPFPAILTRTPYAMRNPADQPEGSLTRKLLAHGYAIVEQNERGMYWSEGRHTYLAGADTDGYDTIDWITKQPWSSKKIGTHGCSSTAEDQLALLGTNHPAHQAAIVMGYGAGVGRIGPFAEQGNMFRGGALQLLFALWFRNAITASGPSADLHPKFPAGLTPEQKIGLDKMYSLQLVNGLAGQKQTDIELMKFFAHLPVADLVKESGGPSTDWDLFARRTPGDPAWAQTPFANEGETFGVPAIWAVSLYDVSVGPNLYLYEYATRHLAKGRPQNEQFLIVGPGTHCFFGRAKSDTPVGEMSVGDATYDYDQRFIDFYDWKLKGVANKAAKEARVQVYQLGDNRWTSSDTFPVSKPKYLDLYLASGKGANSYFGDGQLVTAPPAGGTASDTFVYDPLKPVQTLGGGACCMGTLPVQGAYDQAPVEARNDVLVYTTPPLKKAVAVRGPVAVELYVSSTAKDTDFTVKLVDVHPDGKAYNLDDTIFRARYREGYEKAVFMQPGGVYKLLIPPMFTANTFKEGHRIRVQVTSSNFPRYDRNLNTGGDNATESQPVTATNTVHHSGDHLSRVRLSVLEP